MSLHTIAHHMASKGRGEDSMLVHMTPGEVAGLQKLALSHGGSLTVNPETGLVEAGWLSKLLPMIAGFALGPAGFGLMSAGTAALTVGGATALATGSLSKGLQAGLGAYGGAGLGEAFMGAGTNALTNAGVANYADTLASQGLAPGTAAYGDAASKLALESQAAASQAPLMDKLGAGFKAVTASPESALGFAKDNWRMGLAAASPVIADAMVPTATKMPTTNNQGIGAYIRPYDYDPRTQGFTRIEPIKVKNGGLLALAGGGDPADDPNSRFNNLTGQSKAAYDYLMGNADRSFVPPSAGVGAGQTGPVFTSLQTPASAAAPATGGGGEMSPTTPIDVPTGPTLPYEPPAEFNLPQDPIYEDPIPDPVFEDPADFWQPNTPVDPDELNPYEPNPVVNTGEDFWMPNTPVDPDELNPYEPNPVVNTGEDFWMPNTPVDPNEVNPYEPNPVVNTEEDFWMPNTPVDPNEVNPYEPNVFEPKSEPVKEPEPAPYVPEPAPYVPEPEPVVEPTPEPYVPEPEPVVEPTPEPYVPEPEPVVEPTSEPYVPEPEPVVEPTPEPYVPYAPEPVAEPVVEPTPEPYAPYVPEPEPVVEPEPEPVVEPEPEPVVEPEPAPYVPEPEPEPAPYVPEPEPYIPAEEPRTPGYQDIYQPEEPYIPAEAPTTPEEERQAAIEEYLYGGGRADNMLKEYGGNAGYSDFGEDGYNYLGAANGGLMAAHYAMGGMSGMSHLGGYSDGGRLLKGPGDGVSDSIPASIGKHRQPARLADGEFVVPARIVSELGNGSTEAGARKLYAMMDRIQKARGKTVGKGKVATNSRADKHLPA